MAHCSREQMGPDWFERGDPELKRHIVQIACSNTTLTDKILSVQAAKWVEGLLKLARCRVRRGRVEDVRILPTSGDDQFAALIAFMRKSKEDEQRAA